MAQEPMMWALTQGSQFQVAPGDTTMESAGSKGTWESWPYGKLCIQKDQETCLGGGGVHMPWVTSHSHKGALAIQSIEMPPLWLGPLQDCQWLRGGVVYSVDQVKQLDGPGIPIQHVRSVPNGDLAM